MKKKAGLTLAFSKNQDATIQEVSELTEHIKKKP